MAVTIQDRAEWSQHPVTMELVGFLGESKQQTMEAWANEHYVGATQEQTAAQNAKALGGIDLLNKVLELLASYQPEELSGTVEGGAHHDTASY